LLRIDDRVLAVNRDVDRDAHVDGHVAGRVDDSPVLMAATLGQVGLAEDLRGWQSR
jgi:hypothetical protein